MNHHHLDSWSVYHQSVKVDAQFGWKERTNNALNYFWSQVFFANLVLLAKTILPATPFSFFEWMDQHYVVYFIEAYCTVAGLQKMSLRNLKPNNNNNTLLLWEENGEQGQRDGVIFVEAGEPKSLIRGHELSVVGIVELWPHLLPCLPSLQYENPLIPACRHRPLVICILPS